MQKQQRIFIELFITTINSSGFVYHSLPRRIFISYLKLSGEYKAEKEQLIQKYDRTSKTYFQEHISVSNFEEELNEKLESFQRRTESISTVSSYEFSPNDSTEHEFQSLIEYYYSKTGHKRDKPLKVNRYDQVDLISTQKKITQIGRDCLELKVLSEIQDELSFSDIYTHSDLKIADTVADACWELFQADNSISREQLINSVTHEYFIKRYEDLPVKDRDKKVKRTAQQWVNDNQESLQIT